MKKALLIFLALFILLIVISFIIVLLQKNIPIGEKVALVRIEGMITDSKDTVDEIKEYAKDPSIKAIVMRIDSPGGAVAPHRRSTKR